ncbi:MAG TPA: diguanylate cyclase [Gemmatimonadales bacterium]|nr:diguanylate cyclase [Gemmatimonadales bacterium]
MPTRGPAARPVDLLIASTDEWTSRSLATILAPHGYVVHTTYNRAQTLAHIQNNPPDALILAEHLPDGDAYSLSRELHEENLISPSTPVFLSLPRPPTRRDRLAALHAGVWECLGQPLDAEELQAMLDVFVPAKLDADEARAAGLMDDVTGVYNLRGFMRRADELAAHAARRHSALGCVYLMPELEPTPGGPETGEVPVWLLRRVGTALRSIARHSDAIGRVSANSFAVIATDTDALQARQLARRLAAAIVAESATPSVPRMPRLRVRAGCHGVSRIDPPLDVKTLLLYASIALQRARADSAEEWLQGYSA